MAMAWDYYHIPALEPRVLEPLVEGVEMILDQPTAQSAAQWRWLSLVELKQCLGKLQEQALPWAKQGLRMAAVSLGIFLVGFGLMNAPAYTDILKTAWGEWLNQPDDTRLEEQFVKRVPVEQELIAVTKNSEKSALTLPSLDLEVAPLDNRLIIPKLDKNIPLVESDPAKLVNADWKSMEQTFQEDLQKGVLHYPGTAEPGEAGNVFITGHSSYYLWADGAYKNVFARLNQLEVGDDFIVYYDQQKYHYRVREKKEVKRDDVSVLSQTEEHLLTLMTCSPVGTNLRRLIVIAEEIQD